MYKLSITILILALVLLAGGCRQRVIKSPDPHPAASQPAQPEAEPAQSTPGGEPSRAVASEDETATAGMPSPGEGGAPSGSDIARATSPDGAAGQTKPSDGGGVIGLIEDEYGGLLAEGLGSLYECQRGFVYFELTGDYLTIDSSAEIHGLILAAGGYNVAEKKRDGRSDDGWVIRKNPTLIIKCVSPETLGGGVADTAAAEKAYAALVSRPGWENIGAVINGSVLLVSETLTESESGRFLLKLYMAGAMYPELFAAVDTDALAQTLLGGGIYAYK